MSDIATLGWSPAKVNLAEDALVLDIDCGAWLSDAATQLRCRFVMAASTS